MRFLARLKLRFGHAPNGRRVLTFVVRNMAFLKSRLFADIVAASQAARRWAGEIGRAFFQAKLGGFVINL